MYWAILVIICVGGTLYLRHLNAKYQNDQTSAKEEIINYFQEQGALDLDHGIKVRDLPRDIAKNPYLMMMVKDKTLTFEKGKYYLNP